MDDIRYVDSVHKAVGSRPCVVALGGGADSAVLLHTAVQANSGSTVRAVFADHSLESSELLKQAAIDCAAVVGVPLTIVDAAVDDGSDLENRARDARYTTIESCLEEDEVVLTGHTADDQAETVLMRLMRGSGAGGLAAIPPVRGRILRPFLGFWRAELRADALRIGLPFVDDPANTDDRFLRSRIRHHLLPEIEANYAPGIAGDLVRTAGLARSDDDLLTSLSARIPITTVAGHVAIPVPAVVAAASPVASRAIRTALRLCGDVYPGSMRDVDAVMEVARVGATAVVSGSVRVHREPPMIVFQVGATRQGDEPLSIGDASGFQWNGHSYAVHSAVQPVAVRTAGRFSVVAASQEEEVVGVRGVEEGDRLDIGQGSSPVTELLRDYGVSPMLRPTWPLVAIGGRIAAVHGIRTAVWAQPRNGDKVMVIEREVDS